VLPVSGAVNVSLPRGLAAGFCWWLEIDGLFGYAACAFPSMGTLSRLDVG
jgi:hypothetical protein